MADVESVPAALDGADGATAPGQRAVAAAQRLDGADGATAPGQRAVAAAQRLAAYACTRTPVAVLIRRLRAAVGAALAWVWRRIPAAPTPLRAAQLLHAALRRVLQAAPVRGLLWVMAQLLSLRVVVAGHGEGTGATAHVTTRLAILFGMLRVGTRASIQLARPSVQPGPLLPEVVLGGRAPQPPAPRERAARAAPRPGVPRPPWAWWAAPQRALPDTAAAAASPPTPPAAAWSPAREEVRLLCSAELRSSIMAFLRDAAGREGGDYLLLGGGTAGPGNGGDPGGQSGPSLNGGLQPVRQDADPPPIGLRSVRESRELFEGLGAAREEASPPRSTGEHGSPPRGHPEGPFEAPKQRQHQQQQQRRQQQQQQQQQQQHPPQSVQQQTHEQQQAAAAGRAPPLGAASAALWQSAHPTGRVSPIAYPALKHGLNPRGESGSRPRGAGANAAARSKPLPAAPFTVTAPAFPVAAAAAGPKPPSPPVRASQSPGPTGAGAGAARDGLLSLLGGAVEQLPAAAGGMLASRREVVGTP